MDTEKQRQRRRDDMRLTESGNTSSEQLLVVPTESLTNRVWLEWIRMSKAQLFFRYEISLVLECITFFDVVIYLALSPNSVSPLGETLSDHPLCIQGLY